MTLQLNSTLRLKIQQEISAQWDQDITPALTEYIKIPNKSPAFEADWQEKGHMARAMQLIENWCRAQPIRGMQIKLLQGTNRTPLLFIDIPGNKEDVILLYGHMDKQPEMIGWDVDLGPWQPVLKDNKLYGRGGADDGYAIFTILSAIATLQRHNLPHAHCKIIIEASEESGSPDLAFYLEQLGAELGNPKLVICLDSGAANYEQLWSTTSLRGIVMGLLSIEIMKGGVHSGCASGIVPNPFSILRELLDRIEDAQTGKIVVPDFYTEIPAQHLAQAQETAKLVGQELYSFYEFLPQVQMLTTDARELLLNRCWRPALTITGISGLPETEKAGNVTVPSVKAKLSLRLPPTIPAKQAASTLQKILEEKPPFNAKVHFKILEANDGWKAPSLAPWLEQLTTQASQQFFEKPAAYMGEGGTIPFMGMLGKKFPHAQFLITGVLGPNSNAHGPNEFLHIPYAKKLTAAIAMIIAGEFAHS